MTGWSLLEEIITSRDEVLALGVSDGDGGLYTPMG